MGLRKHVRWQPVAQNSIAGAGNDSEMVVFGNPTNSDRLRGLADFSIPGPIRALSQVEGVDFPFYTRHQQAMRPPQERYNHARLVWAFKGVRSSDGIGLPLPIFAADADTTPLFVGKHFELALPNIARKKLEAGAKAGRATEEAPGAWIEIIPATEYTVTVCDLLSEIQAHLLEDVNGGVSWSSGLWTVEEVVSYMNLRISRFLMETGVIQVRATQTALSAETFYNLPTDLIDVRRVAWTSGGTTTVLPRTDSFTADIWENGWEAGGTPQAHMLVPEKSLELRTVPHPSTDGTLDLIYVKNPSAVTANCAILPIPDEWTPFVKWGVISDMLGKEGEANDPQRAGYAEKRWEEGVTLAKLYQGGPV